MPFNPRTVIKPRILKFARLNYPSSPSTNQVYTLNDKTWLFNGNAWTIASTTTDSRMLTLISPGAGAQNISLFTASVPGTALVIFARRLGGTGAVINIRKNGTTALRSADLSLTTEEWFDGGTLQNTGFISGDYFEVQIISTAGSPTEVAVQLTFLQVG
jgi:hypothetical protein